MGKHSRESLNSLAIAAQICPCFSRKHEIARISREFREIKTENVKKIRELSTRTCMHILRKQRKGQKWEKRSKKAKNSPTHPLAQAKMEFIALIVKIEINKILFRSLCY